MSQSKVRKTVEMDVQLAESVQKMADGKNWSFSYMSYVLLQQAVKEKLRKSKNGQSEESNT